MKLLTLAAMSAAISSSFGRVNSLTGATLVLAMTKAGLFIHLKVGDCTISLDVGICKHMKLSSSG